MTHKENYDNSNIIDNKKIISGLSWNIIQVLVRDGFKFLVKLVLARLVVPEDFGLIGIALVFTGLVETVNELGISAALIQKEEDKIREEHIMTGFWTTLVFGCVCFILMAGLVSKFVALFYNEPKLEKIVIILSVPLLLKPFSVIQRVICTRLLNFKPLVLIESIGTVVAGVISVILASVGFGVWAIALQSVISSIIIVVLFWLVIDWRPKLVFSFCALKELGNYGSFVLVKKVIVYFVGNVDYLIIGKILGSYSLGIYTLAFTMTDVFRRQLMMVVNKVMFPVYAKLQNDKANVAQYYLKIIKYNAIVIYPLMTGMIFYANSVILIFFGKEWIEAVTPLQLLSIAIFFHVASGSLSTLLTGIGKAKLDFYVYLFKTIVFIVPLVLVLTYLGGIDGAALAIAISKAISFGINIIIVKVNLEISATKLLESIRTPILGCGIILITSFLMTKLFGGVESLIQFIVYILISGAVYLLIIWSFEKEEIIILRKRINESSIKRDN